MYHKFSSHGPGLRVLGLRAAGSQFQGLVSRVPGSTQVLILDYAYKNITPKPHNKEKQEKQFKVLKASFKDHIERDRFK